jgi:hypothetical protein
VDRFPIVSWDHLNGVPGATVKKSAVWSFADAFLTADAQVRINLDAAKGGVIFVGHPEHAGFDWAVFYASWRTRAARAAIGGDRKYSRSLLARCLSVAL